MKKIAIDARFWGTPGGFGRYLREIITRLPSHDTDNKYYIIIRKRKDHPDLGPNFHYIELDIPWYSWQEQLILPWHLFHLNVDLVHFAHFNIPLLYRKKFIVTIHDLIMIRFPSHKASLLPRWLFGLKYLAYQVALRNAARSAQTIITPSQWTKDDIIRYLHLTPDTIKVIHEASGMGHAAPADISQRQLLYVGNCYPHKKVDLLCEAFAAIADHDRDITLKLIIPDDYFSRALTRRIELMSKHIRDRVSIEHGITDTALQTYYQSSLALVLPSEHEGFGLPGLEAMSCGLPVIASRASCFPEIYGSAAYYFESGDKQSLIDAIGQIISQASLRDSYRAAGYQQVAKYSWSDAAQQTLDLYLRT